MRMADLATWRRRRRRGLPHRPPTGLTPLASPLPAASEETLEENNGCSMAGVPSKGLAPPSPTPQHFMRSVEEKWRTQSGRMLQNGGGSYITDKPSLNHCSTHMRIEQFLTILTIMTANWLFARFIDYLYWTGCTHKEDPSCLARLPPLAGMALHTIEGLPQGRALESGEVARFKKGALGFFI